MRTDWFVESDDACSLETALRIIDALLSTCELNMDDMETETLEAIRLAGRFQNLAANRGYQTNGWED